MDSQSIICYLAGSQWRRFSVCLVGSSEPTTSPGLDLSPRLLPPRLSAQLIIWHEVFPKSEKKRARPKKGSLRKIRRRQKVRAAEASPLKIARVLLDLLLLYAAADWRFSSAGEQSCCCWRSSCGWTSAAARAAVLIGWLMWAQDKHVCFFHSNRVIFTEKLSLLSLII